MKTYEAMFLLDAGNTDFDITSAPVREVLERAGAEILSIKPWDERRLAFKIKGRKRALYVLTYFKVDPSKIGEMQHDIQLNDRLLRAMIVAGDHVSEEQINADTPATLAESRKVAAEAELAAKKEAEAEATSDEQTPSEETAPDEAPETPEVTETTETPEVTQSPETETPEMSEATETQAVETDEDTDTTDKDSQA